MADANKVVPGLSGSGKTTLIKNKLIPEAVEQGNKVPIVDVEDEYGDVSDAKIKSPEKFVHAFQEGHDVVRWVPPTKPPTKPENLEYNGEILDHAIMCWTAYNGDTQALIEEAHNFQSNRKMYSGNMFKLMKQGDKYGHNVMQASQEPQDFHRASWNNGGDIIVMRLRNVPGKLDDLLDEADPTELDRYHYILLPSDPYKEERIYPPISI